MLKLMMEANIAIRKAYLAMKFKLSKMTILKMIPPLTWNNYMNRLKFLAKTLIN